MVFSAIPRSLVVYSSPDTLDRLRLDKEHRKIDQVLSKHQLPEYIIRRIHAATLIDVGVALREHDYELILFSCHGDNNGLYLEGVSSHAATSWVLLTNTLKDTAQNLSVVILNACYSASAQKTLHDAAPFVIAMDGSADDTAAIAFSQHFFDEFYRTPAVANAFRQASSALNQMCLYENIKPVLSRREPSGNSVVQACFDRRQDSIFVDLSEAEDSISKLPISRHLFHSLLTRKIRVHSWIFMVERERAVLPIGQFFGVFSWRNATDVVICHEVLQLKPDLDVDECMGWTRLMVIYNDLRSERYRLVAQPAAIENQGLLSRALDSLEICYSHTLLGSDVTPAAQKLTPLQYTVTLSTVHAQCDLAKQCLENSNLKRAVIALETAISSIHDLVNELTAAVTTTAQQKKGAQPKH